MTEKLMTYFKGDELASEVWLEKYAIEDVEETPDDMHRRMAKEFARIDKEYQKSEYSTEYPEGVLSRYYSHKRSDLTEESIYGFFKDFKYIVPQGSIMSQLGAPQIGSLSNCFVIGTPEDSYGGIFQKDEEMVQLMKRRGGVGIDISTLRPAETAVSNAAMTTTGAVSFMHRYSNSTREVAQNGRRGALMLSIDVNHPDVMDFIKIKRDGTSVTGANISVKINNDFMKAVEADEDYVLRFPCDLTLDFEVDDKFGYGVLYDVWDCKDKTKTTGYFKRIKAKEYWKEIIKSAHGYAEPGIIFVDNHHNYSPDGVYPQFKGVTTNPCGEIFMQPYDACRLIAINLFSFVNNPFTSDSEFDARKFYEVVYEAMRLSDNLIDLEIEHIDRIIEKVKVDSESHDVKARELALWTKIKKTAEASRRTGLGFTALGDTLAALGYKYDSDEALLFTEQFMHIQMEAELDCTIDMAITRGPFKGWDINTEFDKEIPKNSYGELSVEGKNSFYQFLVENYPEQTKRMTKHGRRNVSWNTVAPTGTVSMLTQTTSGLEPVFSIQPYIRRKKINPNNKKARVDFTDELGDTWQEFIVIHHKLTDYISVKDPSINFNPKDKEEQDKLMVDIQRFLSENVTPWDGSTANDIDWVKRVEIQGIIQKYITHSISSTINLPNTVSEDEVAEIYIESWKKGLKGVTVYRDGSRSGVLVSEPSKELVTFHDNHAPKRPKSLPCKIVRFNNNYEKWIAFVGLMDNKPYEIFTGKADSVDLPSSVEVGEIKKIKSDDSKRYDFVYDGGVVENISDISSPDYWNYGKLISGMLRHGMPLIFVIDTIQNLTWDSDNINTWKAGMARALKKFIKDGKVEGIKCADCGSESIIFEEGCSKCKNCGSSKCG